MAEVIVLNDQDVEKLVSFEENLKLVEQAFADFSRGKSHVFPVIREKIAKQQGIFGVKSGYLETQNVLGFKAGGFWSGNKDRGLASHQSVMVLFDSSTGEPSAFVAANYVTQIRTAAVGAIGCKYLARPASRVLAVIGAGQQGRNQLAATLKVMPSFQEVRIYDQDRAMATALAKDVARYIPKVVTEKEPRPACAEADVIVTAASSYQAIVLAEWIRPGTHINAVGTDTRGKQELDPEIFRRAKLVVDNISQCLYLGESQHAYDAGIITRESIYAEIGEIISGMKPGRTTPDEITLLDTTGVAIQDLATAGYAVDQARKKGLGTRVWL
ncbi:MAG TPA: ornithine cyclodeaminase family protein [Selenomonadales bacterium]|nr:ornithine cyclodeaminase family protein [Selenomonadales bacterium]